MSRRRNRTIKAGEQININPYNSKLMPRKKKAVTLAEVNGSIKNKLYPDYIRS